MASADQQTPGGRQRGNDTGPTAAEVARNVARYRKRVGWTAEHLAAELESAGRRATRDTVMKMESGARRIDVDDLVALAHVLDVSPLALLLPQTTTPDEPVRFSGDTQGYNGLRAAQWNEDGIYTARDVWEWALGLESLKTDDVHGGGKSSDNLWRQWQLRSLPDWLPHPPRPKDEDYDG